MLKGLLVVTSLSLSFISVAQENIKAQFQSAYSEYQKVAQSNDRKARRQLARESYELGCEYFGQESLNCGALALNYAHELRSDVDIINQLFDHALSIYKLKYPENSFQIADIYYQQAKSNVRNNERLAKRVAQKALDIADELSESEPLTSATIKFNIGKLLLSVPGSDKSSIEEAYNEFVVLLEADDTRLIEARTLLAKYYRQQGDMRESIELLEENVDIFESNTSVSHPYELSNRAFLVEAYEYRKNSSKATEHCIAIGKLKPWDPNQEQVPLYRVQAEYPRVAALRRKEGWVQLEFYVDEQGFVVEPKVLASSDEKFFIKESLAAVKQWRFAPKFENGKPIKASSTVQFDFSMRN